MFKRPLDSLEGLSQAEVQEKLDKIREQEYTREEERDLIRAAFKAFLPATIGVILAFSLIILLILLWLS